MRKPSRPFANRFIQTHCSPPVFGAETPSPPRLRRCRPLSFHRFAADCGFWPGALVRAGLSWWICGCVWWGGRICGWECGWRWIGEKSYTLLLTVHGFIATKIRPAKWTPTWTRNPDPPPLCPLSSPCLRASSCSLRESSQRKPPPSEDSGGEVYRSGLLSSGSLRAWVQIQGPWFPGSWRRRC